MKSSETTARLRRFEADEKSRKVAGLDRMIVEFEGMCVDLDRQIRAEEDRSGVRDPHHFNYSTFAKSAALRRDNLLASIENLRLQRDAAARERDDALENLQINTTMEPMGQLRNNRRRHDRELKAELR